MRFLSAILLAFCLCGAASGQTRSAKAPDLDKQMKGFDAFAEKVMRDWNTPGMAIGIVSKDKLVWSKGYGYRDLEKRLPVTAETLFPIASNTKLFTAVAAGLLVEEGKLAWDQPIRTFDPSITFYNDALTSSVTLRDMLSHRTGISRHDGIWYQSSFTRKEMFERLKYLEPSQPLRQGYLYNNLMYMGVGYVLEHVTGTTWEDFVRARLLRPLGMSRTVFRTDDMEKDKDFAYAYYELRDTTTLKQFPLNRHMEGVGPCGSMISSINEMSHWLIALMNNGRYAGKQVLPESVLKATLQPAMATPNIALETKGYDEVINSVYGMGRSFASFKGHYLTQHGGALGGFYSQVSTALYDGVGVIVLVNAAHNSAVPDLVTKTIYDRVLGLAPTPWNDRAHSAYVANKKAAVESRKASNEEKIANAPASHPLADYAGTFEDAAYGVVTIRQEGDKLRFQFNQTDLPLAHFHYDRFDTPDDQIQGLWSVNFSTNPQGDVDRALISMDESEVSFTREADASLSDPVTLSRYVGLYETKAGTTVEVKSPDSKTLQLVYPGQPAYELVPYKPAKFRFKRFSDKTVEFFHDQEKISGCVIRDPAGETRLTRK